MAIEARAPQTSNGELKGKGVPTALAAFTSRWGGTKGGVMSSDGNMPDAESLERTIAELKDRSSRLKERCIFVADRGQQILARSVVARRRAQVAMTVAMDQLTRPRQRFV
jgi:hypothetical protein